MEVQSLLNLAYLASRKISRVDGRGPLTYPKGLDSWAGRNALFPTLSRPAQPTTRAASGSPVIAAPGFSREHPFDAQGG